MLIQHICSAYSDQPLYRELCYSLSKTIPETEQRVFVPVRKQSLVGKNLPMLDSISVDQRFLLRPHHRVFFRNKIAKVCKELVSSNNFLEVDLVHSHFLFSDGAVALKLFQNFGTPFITAVRNTDINAFFRFRPDLKSIAYDVLDKASAVVCLNHPYRNMLLEKVPSSLRKSIENKTYVVPNGVEQSWLNNLSSAPDTRKVGSFRCIYVGDLSKNKNIETTINAINSLRENGKDVELIVVGAGGNGEKRFKALQNKHSFVFYLGRINDRDKLREVLRAGDLFVMPSFKETFGLVYIEAMSQGLPIVYSEGQGIDGYFDETRVGEKVNPRDVDCVAQAIEKIILDTPSYVRNCNAEAARFSWHTVAQAYKEIYERVSL